MVFGECEPVFKCDRWGGEAVIEELVFLLLCFVCCWRLDTPRSNSRSPHSSTLLGDTVTNTEIGVGC